MSGVGVDELTGHLLEAKHKKNIKQVLNIIEEIKANFLDRYSIVISTLRHCW